MGKLILILKISQYDFTGINHFAGKGLEVYLWFPEFQKNIFFPLAD